MLTADAIRAVLADVTYRTDWWFEVTDHPEGPVVWIMADVVNSREPGDTRLRIQTFPSPNDTASPPAFLRWLSWRLQRVENHESREFLRFRGELVDDPHA